MLHISLFLISHSPFLYLFDASCTLTHLFFHPSPPCILHPFPSLPAYTSSFLPYSCPQHSPLLSFTAYKSPSLSHLPVLHPHLPCFMPSTLFLLSPFTPLAPLTPAPLRQVHSVIGGSELFKKNCRPSASSASPRRLSCLGEVKRVIWL